MTAGVSGKLVCGYMYALFLLVSPQKAAQEAGKLLAGVKIPQPQPKKDKQQQQQDNQQPDKDNAREASKRVTRGSKKKIVDSSDSGASGGSINDEWSSDDGSSGDKTTKQKSQRKQQTAKRQRTVVGDDIPLPARQEMFGTPKHSKQLSPADRVRRYPPLVAAALMADALSVPGPALTSCMPSFQP